ncbi:MAG: glycoside hydrolase family 76 protein [Mediterranea sp.]|nr:glycoside hydrolase family 76 protein [Mediterranea sp.]
MRLSKTLLTLLPALFVSCTGDAEEKYVPPTPIAPPDTGTEVVYHERAKAQFDLINQYYQVRTGATSGLYNENYPKQASDNSASFLWGYDGLVSGVATLQALGYDVNYTAFIDRFELYHRPSAGQVNLPGYGSQTDGVNGGGTRYYDDNSIVGLDLVEAYNLTKDSRFLTRARQIVTFLKSGEDDIFGGGLWWDEDEKNIPGNTNSNKPACSNGFATLFLLNYYAVCPQDEKADVLAFAKRLYNWVKTNLRDPADGCYWNDKQVDGSINKMKWTYNSGAMISSGVRLYNYTGEQAYLDDAIASAQGAYSYFVRPAAGLSLAYPDHDPWFTIKLVKAFIDIEPHYKAAGSYVDTFVKFLDHAYDHARLDNGLFYEDWTGASPKRAEQLLMQAAALESLGVVALYKGEHKGE